MYPEEGRSAIAAAATDLPTFAVSLVDSARTHLEIARAAAAIAERPSSRITSAWAARPWNVMSRCLRGWCPENDVADGRGLVVDVADPRSKPRVIERICAEQADFFFRREDELDPCVTTVLRTARGVSPRA